MRYFFLISLCWFQTLFASVLDCPFLELTVGEDNHRYSVIPYEWLDFSTMIPKKTAVDEDGCERQVFYEPASNAYIKIWSQGYSKISNFYSALACNYYEGLSPLLGIIIDKNMQYRGYATYGKHNKNLNLKLKENRHRYLCLADAAEQNTYFHMMYKSLLKKYLESDLFYFDLVPSNIVTDYFAYYIIDLESLFTRQELCELRNLSPERFTYLMEHLPPEYATFIESTLN